MLDFMLRGMGILYLYKEMGLVMDIQNAKIAFDLDGVIADIVTPLITESKNRYGIRFGYSSITDYFIPECTPLSFEQCYDILEWLLSKKALDVIFPYWDAYFFLKSLPYDPIIITARKTEEPAFIWLKRWFGDGFHLHVVGDYQNKLAVLKELGIGFYVDDRGDAAVYFRENGIDTFLVDRPWNRHIDYPLLYRIVSLWNLPYL